MTKVEVGQPVEMAWQAHDARAGLNVVAEVFSVYGDILGHFTLSHFAGGLYFFREYLMPEMNIMVQYTARDSQDYEVVSEMFQAVPRPKADPKFIDGAVVSTVKNSDFIEGVIYETSNPK